MTTYVQTIIEKIKTGKFAISQIETIRKNALSNKNGQAVVDICDFYLKESNKDNSRNTRERGIAECLKEMEKRGAKVSKRKEGNKIFLVVTSPNGKQSDVLVRSKTSGTWQTSIAYAEKSKPNNNEHEFWIFTDLEPSIPTFIIVPAWWIKNNIYEVHNQYLSDHGGMRKYNDSATHHAVEFHRIKKWEAKWELLNLNTVAA
ncbi:hypothetical protein [Aliivibrio fischeri]|uniref:hypothetical protein n=1 Tax=Aliivibrio fischeri TaxID=668 RepID=UPI0018C8183A|nr:hypothetical protein [Aliivibrio fischeri]